MHQQLKLEVVTDAAAVTGFDGLSLPISEMQTLEKAGSMPSTISGQIKI